MGVRPQSCSPRWVVRAGAVCSPTLEELGWCHRVVPMVVVVMVETRVCWGVGKLPIARVVSPPAAWWLQCASCTATPSVGSVE